MHVFVLLLLAAAISCLSGQSCDSGNGFCVDTKKEGASCTGLYKSGFCAGNSNILCCEPNASVPDRCLLGGGPGLLPNSHMFTLQNQGFAGHPGALVYIPPNFELIGADAGESPKIEELVVYIHGYNNCISNVVRQTFEACNCSASNDVRVGYNLISQFEEVASQRAASHALLVVAEVQYDLASDSPGRWAETNLFKAFLDELLRDHLSPLLLKSSATLSSSDISRIRIFSHSGGYYVIGNMATLGGMKGTVRELVYANFAQFDSFVTSNLASFGKSPAQFRFSSLYTSNGGTAANNVAMAARARNWTQEANMSSSILLVDDTLSPLTEEDASKYPLIFKLVNMTHDQIPATMFKMFLVGL